MVAVFLVVELAVRVFAGSLPEPQRWSTPETQYKVDQLAQRGHVDIAVVGSSVVDVSLDPSVLGDHVYNAALGAATMRMIAAFADHVVVPSLSPDTVVVGISSRELNANAPQAGTIEADFFDAPGARQAFGTEGVLDRLDRVLSDVSYTVRYRSVLRSPRNFFDPEPAWDGTVTADDGFYLGFLDERYHGEASVLRRMRDGALHDFSIGEDQLGTLRQLLTGLVSQGRRVLLVATPVTADYVASYPHGAQDHELFLTTVETLADEVGVEFVSAGVWGDEFMADPLHANGAGAARLSSLVAGALG